VPGAVAAAGACCCIRDLVRGDILKRHPASSTANPGPSGTTSIGKSSLFLLLLRNFTVKFPACNKLKRYRLTVGVRAVVFGNIHGWHETSVPMMSASNGLIQFKRERLMNRGVLHRTAIAFGCAALVVGPALAEEPARLSGYNANISESSVSGISSGAFMAVQFGTAWSSVIRGVGVVAGGPFWCAKADADAALTALQSDLGTARLRRDDARRRLRGAEDALTAAEDAYDKGKQASREAAAVVKEAKAALR